MEALNVAILKAQTLDIFHGAEVGIDKVPISHLQFADDALIIGKWSTFNVRNLSRILTCFHLASGLKVSFNKIRMWEFLRLFIQDHTGRIILFGDSNEVRNEIERFGSSFSSGDAAIFNYLIHDVGLIDLPMGGRMVTWMNKSVSDHNRILLHCKKSDFGLTPFKKFHSWFARDDFDDVVKEAWSNMSVDEDGSTKSFHDKLKGLKIQLKLWLQELDDVEKLESMDLVQKARVK
nr:RNA-directed DNA polymerase, eukaryota, reverse transcriptase zinc-binding domain protein [Tanacetum cinerariifolium]